MTDIDCFRLVFQPTPTVKPYVKEQEDGRVTVGMMWFDEKGDVQSIIEQTFDHLDADVDQLHAYFSASRARLLRHDSPGQSFPEDIWDSVLLHACSDREGFDRLLSNEELRQEALGLGLAANAGLVLQQGQGLQYFRAFNPRDEVSILEQVDALQHALRHNPEWAAPVAEMLGELADDYPYDSFGAALPDVPVRTLLFAAAYEVIDEVTAPHRQPLIAVLDRSHERPDIHLLERLRMASVSS